MQASKDSPVKRYKTTSQTSEVSPKNLCKTNQVSNSATLFYGDFAENLDHFTADNYFVGNDLAFGRIGIIVF